MTGTTERIDGETHLVLTRMIKAPRDEVWRDLTESDRLSRWIGHWDGDPRSGSVTFFMTAEAAADAEVPGQELRIEECYRPHRFAGSTGWHLWFELDDQGEGTRLRFGQRLAEGDDLGSIGPGWEYYLDRMAMARTSGDVSAIAWEDYFPALQEAYAALTRT